MTLPVAAGALGELGGVESTAAGVSGAAASAGSRTAGVKPARPPARPAQPKAPETGRGSTAKGIAIGSALSRRGGGRRGSSAHARGSGSKGGGAHRVVIAEFIACIVIIGASPILTRPPGSSGHLYVANDFLRLSGVCLLFFILALMSNNPRTARFAAAFGGLVTLGALVNANKALIAIAEIFAPHGGTS